MPLRDHFHPPVSLRWSWQEIHAQWPAMIVLRLFQELPAGFEAGPRVQLGVGFEADVGTHRIESPVVPPLVSVNGGGGTMVEAPPEPSVAVDIDRPTEDEFEVRIYDAVRERRLVAVLEIVSPANKDRPESRRSFVQKCLALLHQGVSVSIVDLVTTRDANLYLDLLHEVGRDDPAMESGQPTLYAATCRTWDLSGSKSHLRTWAFPLVVGQALPRLPVWLSDERLFWLDLEAGYEDTCRVLQIP